MQHLWNNSSDPSQESSRPSNEDIFTTLRLLPVLGVVGDFNGDIQPDLARAIANSNNVSLVLNTSTLTKSAPITAKFERLYAD
ncbi:MAG TPA: hypothetical protein V6D48_00425 [Oculatellaceae cyanobacterium]